MSLLDETRTRSSSLAQRMREQLTQLRLSAPLESFGFTSAEPQQPVQLIPDNWPGDTTAGTDLVQGILRFGGQVVQQHEPCWSPLGASPAFLETLHSFDWLRDLRALGGDVARRQARQLIRSWIEQNVHLGSEIYAPALLGQRLANWLGLYEFFASTADDDFRAMVFDSLRRQARALSRSISSCPPGAGRIRAIKGLFYVGVCLPKGEARIAAALRLLGSELGIQVLGDGGHISRNPQILLQVLRDLIDIRTALRSGAQEIPEKLQHAIDRMTPAVRFFRHGDGGLTLFNGGREDTPAVLEAVLNLSDARGRPLKSMTHSGFERISMGRTTLWFDCGSPPPAGQARTATAGLLSFELSVGRDRLIVNCGAHPTALAAWRKALGATAAHSTVTVNDTNAVELTATGLGRGPQTVTSERQEDGAFTLLEASHDGYEANYKTLHYRRLYVGDNGDDVRGDDTLEGPAGLPFAIRFHLHPAVQASLIQQGQAVLLALPSGAGWRLRAQGGVSLSLEESLYSGRDEEPRRTQQIVLSGLSQDRQTTIKWALQREKKV